MVKRKSGPAVLGEFEQLVMAAILLLGENAYGMTVRARVAQLRPRTPVSLGAVYTTLDRLERKGLVRSRRADPVPKRGGRSKRLFVVGRTGERALRESLGRAARMHFMLGSVPVYGRRSQIAQGGAAGRALR